MRSVIATLLACAAAFGFSAFAAGAQCVGANLFDTMPEAERAALEAQAHAEPFAVGNFWRATKDDKVIHLIGTYHMEDPRHARTMALLAPVLDSAALILVEAGPGEMSALKERMGKEPGLMLITEGPTLPEKLPPDVWDDLTDAMKLRGIPAFAAAKMQPWYLSMMLSIPPCAMTGLALGKGLDGLVIDEALARDLPIRALEPYDTLFGIFASLSEADQLSMITATLALENKSDDMTVTLAESYFREEGRMIWEFTRALTAALPGYTPERVAREFAAMEDAVMISRNKKWIPILTKAAEEGPLLAAFGALHLSGDAGVLALLQAEGFALERLAFQ